MKTARSLVVLCCVLFSFSLWAQSSPIPMLQTTADRILSTLKKNKGQLHHNRNIIYQAVERYLLPNVDVLGMSRSVLGRQAWMKASPNERKEFAKEFTRLVIRTYASPLAEYSEETVKFLPIRGSLNSRFIRVNSLIIRPNGKNIPLRYSLVAKQGQWKIYDLSVEGVSLLQSFRSQFTQVLKNSDMQTLLKAMRDRSNKAAG